MVYLELSRKIGRRSVASLIITPHLEIPDILLVKMLSIRVAVTVVILVG